MMLRFTRVALLVGGLGGVVACSPPQVQCIEGDEPTCDAGALRPDSCNTLESASEAACTLTLCKDTEAYISELEDGGADVDFYGVTLGTLTERSLLQVKGGYGGVNQTAVNFSVNVLKQQPDGGFGAIASGIDQRAPGAVPKNVDIIRPFSESNSNLIIRVSDVGGVAKPRYDNTNTYKLQVCVSDNPDSNEPNDATPTAITLADSNGVKQGTSFGYLATNDDKDVFSFPVGAGRQIIYVHLTSAMKNLMPPLAYRLAYALKDPTGRQIAGGQMANQFLQVDLATAFLAPTMGTYTLEVFGYKEPQQMTPAPGDLRLKYDVDVRVMPDLDMSEGPMGNDSSTTARSQPLTLNVPVTLTGRISYITDSEFFRLELPAGRPGPAVLRYELLPVSGTGRFPALSSIPTRQLRVMKEITTGANPTERQNNCISNATLCPRSFTDPLSNHGQLVKAICTLPDIDPPQCALAERNEEQQIPALTTQKNFVGAIPIGTNVTSVLFMYRDSGKRDVKWADDRDWSIRVVLADDPDESRASPEVINVGTSTTNTSGLISHGYGKTIQFDDLNMGPGVRGPNDYDATETDIDRYRLNFGGAMGDQSWALEWVFGSPDAGSPPGELAFEMTFCQQTSADGGCTGRFGILAPTYSAFSPWYLPPTSLANTRVQFTAQRNGGQTTVRVEPVACFCFQNSVVASGSVLMGVLAVDRTSNDPIPYTVRQSIGAYPTSYPNPDGGAGMNMCPGTNPDGGGGCGFRLGQ